MYHTTLIPNNEIVPKQSCKGALRSFFLEYQEPLGNAAVLLGGRRGARLINSLRDAFAHPGPITRSLRNGLLELRRLLFLEHAYDENWSDEASLVLLEPENPIVPELCLLADTFDEALQKAGLIDIGAGSPA